MRHRFLFTLIAVIAVAAAARPLSAEIPRIRPLDPSVERWLESGYSKSATFRHLVDRLERSDVIVHIEASVQGSLGAVGGTLRFVGHAGGYRFVRITMTARLSRDAAVALLGHELQHAIEVADDASVVDQGGFEAMYERIADRCRDVRLSKSYDTSAARHVQRRIGEELRDSSRSVLAP